MRFAGALNTIGASGGVTCGFFCYPLDRWFIRSYSTILVVIILLCAGSGKKKHLISFFRRT